MTDRPAPDAEQVSAVEEVLDHLLDPLEDVLASRGGTASEDAAPASPASGNGGAPDEPWTALEPLVVRYDGGNWLRDLPARVRWSDEALFRIPRLIARWTVVVAAFAGAVWLILSAGPLR